MKKLFYPIVLIFLFVLFYKSSESFAINFDKTPEEENRTDHYWQIPNLNNLTSSQRFIHNNYGQSIDSRK